VANVKQCCSMANVTWLVMHTTTTTTIQHLCTWYDSYLVAVLTFEITL